MIWSDERVEEPCEGVEGACRLLEPPEMLRPSSGAWLVVEAVVVRGLLTPPPGWTALSCEEGPNVPCPWTAATGIRANNKMEVASRLSRGIRSQ